MPQNPTDEWKSEFSDVTEEQYRCYNGSIGNLLLLSRSINSSLQNNSFDDKKHPKTNDSGKKSGYSDGSYSEIEVSKNENWGLKEIEERGMKLLNFMEERWDLKFKDEQTKKDLLFLDTNLDTKKKR